jgi:hypothetical protein
MRLTRDKLNEAIYYFNIFETKLNGINQLSLLKDIFMAVEHLRFDINSFTNSMRATTLVLQKEYKSKHGKDFETWYADKLKEINANSFFNTLKELRNINQKEGNIYPTFIFKTETSKGNVLFEVDYVGEKGKIIKNLILDGVPDEYEHYKMLYEEAAKTDNFVLNGFKIDRMNISMTPIDFLAQSKECGRIIERIVDEATKKFGE